MDFDFNLSGYNCRDAMQLIMVSNCVVVVVFIVGQLLNGADVDDEPVDFSYVRCCWWHHSASKCVVSIWLIFKIFFFADLSKKVVKKNCYAALLLQCKAMFGLSWRLWENNFELIDGFLLLFFVIFCYSAVSVKSIFIVSEKYFYEVISNGRNL